MRFDAFEKVISKLNTVSLPVIKAQLKMAPPFRDELIERYKEERKTAKPAAVFSLFYPSKTGETLLVLILRKSYQGVHSAQVGFPGGKPESEDKSMEATALRETWEEIGVSSEKITVLRALTPLYIPPSNFIVSPFLGIAREQLNFTLQASEVDAVLEVPVVDFLNDESEVVSDITAAVGNTYNVPAFMLNNHVVWGATAMMLIEIKTMINQILKK